MFDLVLIFNGRGIDHTPRFMLTNPFEQISIYQSVRARRIELKENEFVAFGLTREEKGFDAASVDDHLLLIVGEVFLTNEGMKVLKEEAGKIDAKKIDSLQRSYPDEYINFIKGNFTIVDIHPSLLRAEMINSRFGISPIYYALHDHTLYISTSLKVLHKMSFNAVDGISLIEREVFNYPLAARTLLKDVSQLQPAEIVRFQEGKIEKRTYWQHDSLYQRRLLTEKDAIQTGSGLFKRTVAQQSGDKINICASLTGGFDGRTILSVLRTPKENLLLYSFGIPGSVNITIPQQIARELELHYEPIILDGTYEDEYPARAIESVIQSDCHRTIEGANYPYTFNILSQFSDVVLTGIFGSELMRTFQNAGLMISDDFVEINRSQNSGSVWSSIQKRLVKKSYLKKEIIENNFDAVRDHFTTSVWEAIRHEPENKRFYLFLMREGLRKYFGGEVHAERIYATNRFPYLDDDFVRFIFQSPFAGVYSTALHPTPDQRFRSQFFYAKVMEKYNPRLLKYQTDHGFPASYVLSFFPLMRIAIPYLYNRRKRRKTRYREFKPVEWAELLFQSTGAEGCFESLYTNETLISDYSRSGWKDNFNAFVRACSFNIWLHA